METIGRFSEPEQNNPELEARSSMKAGKLGQSVVTYLYVVKRASSHPNKPPKQVLGSGWLSTRLVSNAAPAFDRGCRVISDFGVLVLLVGRVATYARIGAML